MVLKKINTGIYYSTVFGPLIKYALKINKYMSCGWTRTTVYINVSIIKNQMQSCPEAILFSPLS